MGLELFQYLEANRVGIQNRAARFFLAVDEQNVEDIVRNTVGLVSGIRSGIGGKIPAKYPKPLGTILTDAFSRIRSAKGKILIKKHTEEGYSLLGEGSQKDFIENCDKLRFTLVEDGSSLKIEIML